MEKETLYRYVACQASPEEETAVLTWLEADPAHGRRNAANIMNLERGHKEYEKVKYRYKDMTEAMYELSLLAGNGYTQELDVYKRQV